MKWRQFVEPYVSILRNIRCLANVIVGRAHAGVLSECYKNLLRSRFQYHSELRYMVSSEINCSGSSVKCFLNAVEQLTRRVIDGNGKVDPYIYWRVSLVVNPYILWSYWQKTNNLFWSSVGSGDFLKPMRDAILDANIFDEDMLNTLNRDFHLHFESSLYPDDIMSLLLSKELAFYYTKVRNKMVKKIGFHPPVKFSIPFKIVKFHESFWDSFPRFTLAQHGKELWQSMIISTWELFVRLSYELLIAPTTSPSVYRQWIYKYIKGFYNSSIYNGIGVDFPTLTSKLMNIVMNGAADSEMAVFALLLSNLLWASFGDTYTHGLREFADGIYAHPLKEFVKDIRKTVVKKPSVNSLEKIYATYVRSIDRRIEGEEDVEVRISLIDNFSSPGKYDDTLFVLDGVLSGNLSTYSGGRLSPSARRLLHLIKCSTSLVKREKNKKHMKVVMHYIKLNDSKERTKVISSLVGLSPYNKTIKRWVKETEHTFLYLMSAPYEAKKMLVGFDAASKEMWTPVWLLAPFYRFWYTVSRLYNQYLDVYLSRLTFHAGEDFLDILSGIRRMIDVSIMGLSIGVHQKGMGHAIAFSTDPFYLGIGNAVIPEFEYFMNIWLLTYLYEHYYMPEGYDYQYKGIVREEMKRLLERFNITYTIEDMMILYPYLFKLGSLYVSSYFSSPHVKNVWNIINGIASTSQEDKILTSKTCNVVKALLRKKGVMYKNTVSVSPIFPTSIMDVSEQVVFVEMLSKLIEGYIDSHQIKPEVCVTSNILIRDIPDPFVHPWASKKNNIRDYTVGTDNPTFTLSIPELEYYLVERRKTQ